MRANADPERALLDALDTPARVDAAFDAQLQALDDWQRAVCDLLADALPDPALQRDAALALALQALRVRIAQAPAAWDAQWDALAPARAVAETFDASCMLLVFGKFNAGKSSLCNFLAARVAANGGSTRWFHVQGGVVVDAEAGFVEGATETTARLQGVVLAERLVLLDTPGLHSVTAENAALTRRFTDSADGVLWLSSSTAPGQVQELDDLVLELRRGKPLQPVITRSDRIDEDEVDGALVRVLCNKSDANRRLQETDVATRAAERLRQRDLDAAVLLAPVSLSVHAARTHGDTDDARREAGFDRLYAALQSLAAPALAYKGRKPASMRLHHLQEQVLGDLRDVLSPEIEQLIAAVDTARTALPAQAERIRTGTWRALVGRLPEILDTHAQTRDVVAVRDAVAVDLDSVFAVQAQRTLPDHRFVEPGAQQAFVLAGDADYDAVVVDDGQGGRTQVGIDQARLHDALETAVRAWIEMRTQAVVDATDANLDALSDVLGALQNGVKALSKQLDGIAASIQGNH